VAFCFSAASSTWFFSNYKGKKDAAKIFSAEHDPTQESTSAEYERSKQHKKCVDVGSEDHVVPLLLTLPTTNEAFPNIERVFDFDLKTPNMEKLKVAALRARTIIRLISCFRTDLNQFSEEEKIIIESLGYTLAAFRYRIFCSSLFRDNTGKLIAQSCPFSPEMTLKADFLERNLKGSDNVFYANVFRHLLIHSKSYIEKNQEEEEEIKKATIHAHKDNEPKIDQSKVEEPKVEETKVEENKTEKKKKKKSGTRSKKAPKPAEDTDKHEEIERQEQAPPQEETEKLAKGESKTELKPELLTPEEQKELEHEKKSKLHDSADPRKKSKCIIS